MPEESDVKIGQLPEHHGTITDAIGKHPTKRAHALSTVLHRDYGILVKWKALQTYILRHHLWTSKRPSPAAAMSSTSASAAAMPAAPTAIAAPSVASSSTIIEAKIGDLPRYREMILAAIRANPGTKSIALATILEKSYAVRVHHAALRKFIDREKLYDAASAAPSTPMRGTGAPSTPTGATVQSSPIRASPRKKVHAKLSDLPLSLIHI